MPVIWQSLGCVDAVVASCVVLFSYSCPELEYWLCISRDRQVFSD
jgi:hypothetical protein